MQVSMNFVSTSPPDNWVIGREGEEIIREYLKSVHIHFFQAEIIAKIDGRWQVLEVKHQSIYTPPPFYGHGLPKWQIDARLEFQRDTGTRASLWVVDKDTGIIYWQYMDVLMLGEKYQTHGEKPRLIFPVDSFIILK